MKDSRILKFQSVVYDIHGDEMAKKIIFALLNKSMLLTNPVHCIVSIEERDNIKGLLENEIVKKCFDSLESNFKFDFFPNNEYEYTIMLSNSQYLSSDPLSRKEIYKIDLKEDPFFKGSRCIIK